MVIFIFKAKKEILVIDFFYSAVRLWTLEGPSAPYLLKFIDALNHYLSVLYI